MHLGGACNLPGTTIELEYFVILTHSSTSGYIRYRYIIFVHLDL
jgi:hypothetical protein